MMKLNKTYAIHCLIMFYEIEMMRDWVKGIQNMVEGIENPENITLHIDYSMCQEFEKIDEDALPKDGYLIEEFHNQIDHLKNMGITWRDTIHRHMYNGEPISIAHARRDFNYEYANKVDYLMWGETDSFFPKETFQVLEQISSYADKNKIYKYTITFGYRKMWDAGWKEIEHPKFANEVFQDTDKWNLYNKASEKCYMSIVEMNEINEEYTKDGFDLKILNEPKFDGSCVVFSSELVKSGVNIPHALLMSGEDTSMGWSAKKILGDNYSQFHVKNILRVHNRRHPNKRNYIVGEDNKMGFCGEKDKGIWWKILEQWSKENLHNLDNSQFKFHTWKDYFTSMIQQGYLK